MHPDLKVVIELQRVDQKVADLSAQINALPGQIQTLQSQLNEFIKAHEDRKARLSANQKERRDLEGEVQQTQTKISKHKDQLYEVKTNEQYRAMLKEIEGEEANIRGIEDRILEKMGEAEEIQEHIRDAAARLDGEKTRVAKEIERLESLRQADIQERDELLAERQRLTSALIDRGLLAQYERLREWRGVALAEVRDGLCTACHVRLRPQFYNEVRASETVRTCENCSRILYWVARTVLTEDGKGERVVM